ncbi:MAG: ribosomal RNA small subunit methyltransferase A [Deltaproteobacteria bacterium]|nr:ribosomal RNA small subunit methyltransferase A [Deltaproteobacteria bacterium]
MTESPPKPKDVLALAGLKPKKSWGQNFLTDQNILAIIAGHALNKREIRVVELGPGTGALTWHLIKQGGQVLAIERDREIAPVLRQVFEWADGLEVREEDAAKLDYAALREEIGHPLTVVGNLPYQISSRILVSVTQAYEHVERIVVMIQKEVAERLVAEPGNKTYGLLSVLVQRSFNGKIARHVPPQAFHPPPKVDSSVVVLTRKEQEPGGPSGKSFEDVVKAAFSTRRKTLRNTLSRGLGLAADEVVAMLESISIDPGLRAERLTVEQFVAIAECYENRGAQS